MPRDSSAAGLRSHPMHALMRTRSAREHPCTRTSVAPVSDRRADCWPTGSQGHWLHGHNVAQDIPQKLLYVVKYLRRNIGGKRFKDQIPAQILNACEGEGKSKTKVNPLLRHLYHVTITVINGRTSLSLLSHIGHIIEGIKLIHLFI